MLPGVSNEAKNRLKRFVKKGPQFSKKRPLFLIENCALFMQKERSFTKKERSFFQCIQMFVMQCVKVDKQGDFPVRLPDE